MERCFMPYIRTLNHSILIYIYLMIQLYILFDTTV